MRKKATEAERWLDEFITNHNVVPLDERCFREWGKLMSKRSNRLGLDAMIAATAIIHSLTVATRNVRDFELLGLEPFNPWTFDEH